jgi:hypothetical protein
MEAILREKHGTARDQVRRRWGLGTCRERHDVVAGGGGDEEETRGQG